MEVFIVAGCIIAGPAIKLEVELADVQNGIE